jgi:hypothetical protein
MNFRSLNNELYENASSLQGVPISSVAPTSGEVLQYIAATGLWTPEPVSALPSVQSVQNIGSGQGVYESTVAGVVSLKSLDAGSGISITSTSSDITISATGSYLSDVTFNNPYGYTISTNITGTTENVTFTQTSETQNLVLASPNGSSGTATFRPLVNSDLPAISLENLSDVTITSPVASQILAWNGTDWINQNYSTLPVYYIANVSGGISAVSNTFYYTDQNTINHPISIGSTLMLPSNPNFGDTVQVMNTTSFDIIIATDFNSAFVSVDSNSTSGNGGYISANGAGIGAGGTSYSISLYCSFDQGGQTYWTVQYSSITFISSDGVCVCGGPLPYLASLLDTSISSPSSGQILQYNGSAWINASGSSGGFTTASSTGAGFSLINTGTPPTLILKSVNPTNSIIGTDDGSTITLSLDTTLHNVNTILSTSNSLSLCSVGSGTTTINNFLQLPNVLFDSGVTNLLGINGSNEVIYTNVTIPSSTNIYNSDGTLTAATRNVNSVGGGSTNSTINFNNVNMQYTNNNNLVVANVTDPLSYTMFFNSSGISRAKYEATTCCTRFVSIGALGAAGNFIWFYTNSGTTNYPGWNIHLVLYEDNPTLLTPYVADYWFSVNSADITANYTSVYPQQVSANPNNSQYLVEIGGGNQYILSIRVRNYSGSTLSNTLSAKIESYGEEGQTISTALTSGNLSSINIGFSLLQSLPINWLFFKGQNGSNSLPSIVWDYSIYFPRLVKISYFVSGVSTNAGTNTFVLFTNNGITITSVAMKAVTNNSMVSIAGVLFIEPYPAMSDGELVVGSNTLALSANTTANIDYTGCPYSIDLEFVQK